MNGLSSLSFGNHPLVLGACIRVNKIERYLSIADLLTVLIDGQLFQRCFGHQSA